MKKFIQPALFAIGAVLVAGTAVAAAQAPTEPEAQETATATASAQPSATATPEPKFTIPAIERQRERIDLSQPPSNEPPAPTWTPPLCDPAECDPDEGETISPEELAEIAAADAQALPHPLKQEDDPGWDCYLDGNLICGPKTEGLAVEAWDKFTPAQFPADKLAQPFRVTYHGTARQGVDLPPSVWHTIASSKAGIDHVFRVEFGVVSP